MHGNPKRVDNALFLIGHCERLIGNIPKKKATNLVLLLYDNIKINLFNYINLNLHAFRFYLQNSYLKHRICQC